MYDSMIFDMDGTLVNNLKPMVASWNDTAKKHGWKCDVITYEKLKDCMGLNPMGIGVKLFPEVTPEEAEKRVYICSKEEVEYFDEVEIGYTYIPNIEFLNKLSKNKKLFIVSNCLEGYIEVFLKKYGFEKYFIETVNAGNGMSKAENIKYLVKKYNLKKPAYIGDTLLDQKSCDEANVEFIFASYGFGEVEANKKIKALDELLNM